MDIVSFTPGTRATRSSTLLSSILLVGLMALAGCGPPENGGDDGDAGMADVGPCGGPCEVGTCDPETGQCVEEGFCQADDDCERGLCDEEASECINPEVCEGDEQCLEGFVCHKQSCKNEEQLCDSLGCGEKRGVCSFEERACVDAENCESDEDCLEGDFCNDEGSCEQNKCDAQMVDCERGVCEASTAECKNAETCTSGDECVDMFLCVDESCKPREDVCQKCTGDQSCEYDGDSLDVRCKEPEECDNAFDCLDDRVCRGGSCTDSMACSGDDLEPNDSDEEATNLIEAGGQVTSASICPSDTDLYKWNTQESSAVRGTLFVELNFADVDVGLGTLSVELRDPNGQVAVQKTVGAEGDTPGHLDLKAEVGAAKAGEWTIAVSDDGDVASPGVRYGLTAEFAAKRKIDACGSAETLAIPTMTADTNKGDSLIVEASCVQNTDAATEQIYQFNLDEASFVTIEVDAASDSADLVASVRGKCAVTRTERACSSDAGGGGVETIERTLEAGTYYLIVQGVDDQSGGKFTVNFNSEAVVCTSADDTCKDADTARRCKGDGTGFNEITCDNGCNAQRGACNRIQTDACHTAGDATGGFANPQTIKWGDLQDDLDPGDGGCLGSGQPASDGPDAIYTIDLKANHAMAAELTGSGQNASLYLLDDCQRGASTCREGVDASGSDDERLTYTNDSGSMQTLYLVADSESGTQGQSQLSVEVGEVTCSPGTEKCGMSGDVVACNDIGTEFTQKYACPGTCKNAECAGDTCQVPIDFGKGDTRTIDMSQYNNDYNIGRRNSCTGDDMPTPEIVIQLSVDKGEVIDASATPQKSGDDPHFYLLDDCSSSKSHADICLGGSDSGSNGDKETFRKRIDKAGTYFLVLGGDHSGQASGKYDVDVQVKSTVCKPGTGMCTQADQAKTCGDYGLQYNTQTCGLSCKNGGCLGDSCAAPLDFGRGDSRTLDMSKLNDDYNIDGSNSCTSDDMPTPDAVVEVQANKGDFISATVTPQDSGDDPTFYILDSCSAGSDHAKNCLDGVDDNGGGDPESLRYKAPSQGSYFLVIGGDHGGQADGKFDIDVDVSAPCANPGTSQCTGPDTARICQSNGYPVTRNCVAGCTNGACVGDSCKLPWDFGQGGSTTVDITNFGNDYDISSSNSCSGDDMPTGDMVIEVQAQKDDWITAEIAPQLSSDDPHVYLLDNCSDSKDHGNICLAGADDGHGGDVETFKHQAPAAGSYYLVIGGDDSDDARGKFDIDVDVSAPCNSPGMSSCTGPNEVTTCQQNGYPDTKSCSTSCQNGTCTGDSCKMPVDFGRGDSKTLDMSQFSNDYDIPSSNSCTGDDMPTPDVVASVQAKQGEWISATITPQDSGDDPTAYLLGNCSSMSSQHANDCLAGADDDGGGDTETFRHRVSSTGTYFLVIGGDHGGQAEGKFDVDIDVSAPCNNPGTTACTGPDEVTECSMNGYPDVRSCPAGCQNGGCVGDTCKSPMDFGRGDKKTIDMTAFNDDYDLPSSNSCTGDEMPTSDIVVSVQAQSGETIDVTLEPTVSGDDPTVYLLDKCDHTADHAMTCIDGSDSSSNGQTETFSHKVSTTGTYYLVIGGDFSGQASGDYIVDVQIK